MSPTTRADSCWVGSTVPFHEDVMNLMSLLTNSALTMGRYVTSHRQLFLVYILDTLDYLADCCTPVTDVVGRQRLRSATQQLMVVPRHRMSTVGRRAFAVHGQMIWNSLPDDLCAQQDYESFRHGLKTWLFSRYYRAQRIRDFMTMRYINPHLLLPLPLDRYTDILDVINMIG